MGINNALLLVLLLVNTVIPNNMDTNDYYTTDNIQKNFLIELINIDNMNNYEYIYFGKTTCPGCQRFKPILEKALSEKNIVAYYFNTDTWRQNDSYKEILEVYSIELVPTLIKSLDNNEFEALNLDSIYSDEDLYMAIINFLS